MRISDWSSDVCSSDLHRVAESEGNAPRLGRGDHHLSLLEGHGDRNLQQRVLPGGDRLQCEGRMALARRGNDDDVDLRVGQRLLEADRPMAVAVAPGERARRLRPAADQGVQSHDRKRVGEGTRVYVREYVGGGGRLEKKTKR